jgi:hypothetical protein
MAVYYEAITKHATTQYEQIAEFFLSNLIVHAVITRL